VWLQAGVLGAAGMRQGQQVEELGWRCGGLLASSNHAAIDRLLAM